MAKIALKLDEVSITLGNKGILLKIAGTDGKHIGDLRIGRGNAIWMRGKTTEPNGVKIPILKLVELLEGAG